MEEKQILIKEILELVDKNDSTKTEINLNYLEFFELDDLQDIKDNLLKKNENFHQESNHFLDEIFMKCS
jgi:hypothetical protein